MIPRHLVLSIAVMLAVALGMSFYLWQMRGRARSSDSSAANAQPVAAPVSGPSEQVTLYVAYDDAGVLRPKTVRIPLPRWTPGACFRIAPRSTQFISRQRVTASAACWLGDSRCVPGGTRAGCG